jgi:hypothetical protein
MPIAISSAFVSGFRPLLKISFQFGWCIVRLYVIVYGWCRSMASASFPLFSRMASSGFRVYLPRLVSICCFRKVGQVFLAHACLLLERSAVDEDICLFAGRGPLVSRRLHLLMSLFLSFSLSLSLSPQSALTLPSALSIFFFLFFFLFFCFLIYLYRICYTHDPRVCSLK